MNMLTHEVVFKLFTLQNSETCIHNITLTQIQHCLAYIIGTCCHMVSDTNDLLYSVEQ